MFGAGGLVLEGEANGSGVLWIRGVCVVSEGRSTFDSRRVGDVAGQHRRVVTCPLTHIVHGVSRPSWLSICQVLDTELLWCLSGHNEKFTPCWITGTCGEIVRATSAAVALATKSNATKFPVVSCMLAILLKIATGHRKIGRVSCQ